MWLRPPLEWNKLGFKFYFKHINHITFSQNIEVILIPGLHIHDHFSFCMEEKIDFMQNTSSSYSFHSRRVMGVSERKLHISRQKSPSWCDPFLRMEDLRTKCKNVGPEMSYNLLRANLSWCRMILWHLPVNFTWSIFSWHQVVSFPSPSLV